MRSLRWISVIGFPAGMILIPLGEPLAILLFGEVWQEAGQAAAAMCLFCGGSCLGTIAGESLKAHGQTSKLTEMHLFTTIVTAVLMGALLPFGLVGVAAGLSAGAVAGGLFSLRVAHKTIGFPLRPMWSQIWPPFFAALVMAAAMLPISTWADASSRGGFESALIITGEALVAVCIYAIALRLLGPSLIKELEGPVGSAWARLTRADTDSPVEPEAPSDLNPELLPSRAELATLARRPRYTVVIPAYNAARTLGPAIESVRAQTVQDWELIVIDDGSTDETGKLAAAYEADSRVVAYSQPNAGPAAARNRGIRFARGELVSFLDSDDLMMPGYLAAMGAALDRAPEAALAYTDAWSLDDESRQVHVASAMSGADPPAEPPTESEELLLLLLRENFILASTTVRRRILEDLGGYDESMRFAEDYDLWIRIVSAGHRVAKVPGRLIIQRELSTSLSKDDVTMHEALRDLMDRIAEQDPRPRVAQLARTRSGQLDAIARRLARRGPVGGLVRGTRRLGGRVKRGLRSERPVHPEVPAEVAEAFPDLDAV
jgi:GT2 family glycosyltransferase